MKTGIEGKTTQRTTEALNTAPTRRAIQVQSNVWELIRAESCFLTGKEKRTVTMGEVIARYALKIDARRKRREELK